MQYTRMCVAHVCMCVHKKITEWCPWGAGGCGGEGDLAGCWPGWRWSCLPEFQLQHLQWSWKAVAKLCVHEVKKFRGKASPGGLKQTFCLLWLEVQGTVTSQFEVRNGAFVHRQLLIRDFNKHTLWADEELEAPKADYTPYWKGPQVNFL